MELTVLVDGAVSVVTGLCMPYQMAAMRAMRIRIHSNGEIPLFFSIRISAIRISYVKETQQLRYQTGCNRRDRIVEGKAFITMTITVISALSIQ